VIARAASLLVLVVAPSLVACSGSSSYPDPAPCPPPASASATATPPGRPPGGPPGGSAAAVYTNAIRVGVQRIRDLRADQRSLHPTDKFSRTPEFRTSFATYADDTICTAEALKAVKAPDQRYTDFDESLDASLQALIDHTLAGREAVGQRNTSAYRDWYRDVDAKIDALRVLYDARPR
jgi:hypothetical protein